MCLEKPAHSQGLHCFTSFRKLCVTNLPNVISFPEAGFLSILSELEIGNCSALAYYLML